MNKNNLSEKTHHSPTVSEFAYKHRGKTIVCNVFGKDFYGKIWGYGKPNKTFNKEFLLVKVDRRGFTDPSCQEPVFVIPRKPNYRFFWIEYAEQTKFKIMKKMV